MDLNISSEKIGNPLLVELLKKLTGCFGSIGQTFFVIGATARDIILQQLASTSSSRKTRDLDVAIAIPDWRAFDRITKILVAEGFNKDTHKHQRFTMMITSWMLFHTEVYDWEHFDEYIIGGYWLAHDLTLLLNKEQLIYYHDCIMEELADRKSVV